MVEGAGVAGASRAAAEGTLEALLKLNRAVQRATVYPEGHPSIAAASTLLYRSLESLLEERHALSLGVTGERLLVDEQPLQAGAEALGWLNHRLYELGVGALTFGRGLSSEDVTALVAWLTRKGVAQEPPAMRHIAVTLVEYGRVRFEEERRSDETEVDPLAVWRTLLASLTAGWYQGDVERLPDETEACAAELSAEIERNEGVGAASFLATVIGAGLRLPKLPASARDVVRARLATFVSALSPDLQHQLLHVDPGVSARRLTFISEIADALPDTTLMDVLADLDGRGGRISDAFVTLLNKLVGLSVRDPMLRELTETKLTSIGLPRGLTLLEPGRVRMALEEALQQREEQDYTSADYKGELARLGAAPIKAAVPPERYDDLSSAEATSAHVSAIVLRLLVALPDHPDAPAYLRRLIAQAPRALEAGHYAELLDVATSLRDLLVLRLYLPEETVRLTESYLAQTRQPAVVAQLLQAVERGPSPAPEALVGLIRLGGTDAALETLERLASLPEGEGRERLRPLVAQSRPEVLAEVVTRTRSTGGPLLRALLSVLAHPDTPSRVEYALTFLATRDAAIRREAFAIVIDGDERPGQRERHLQRALTDASPEVRRFAIEVARRRGGDVAVTALRAFLLGVAVPEPGTRESAVAALAEIATPAAQITLAELLNRSHTRLSPGDVRICRAAAGALRGAEDEMIAAAVRGWRRSPSGWVAWLLGHGAEDAGT